MGRQALYCSDAHKFVAMRARRRTRGLLERVGGQSGLRRGDIYESLLNTGLVADLDVGRVSADVVADQLGVTPQGVRQAYRAIRQDRHDLSVRQGNLTRGRGAAIDRLLARDVWPDPGRPPESVEAVCDRFVEFRDLYFRTERDEPYETAPFHRRWIRAIVDAVVGGGQQLILSPPRHGKTDLLTHLAVWLICRSPNIRIMWVGGNEDIARNALGAVMDHLENNTELVRAVTGLADGFKPQSRSGTSWSQAQFTVANRTVTGIKSPTMIALGRGGKILSRDTDLIVCDDIEDHGSTLQPQNRANTRTWMVTTLGSRKEDHTGIVTIGSRQHPDDLYNYLLDNESWDVIVESAHDEACPHPTELPDSHTDCMLWPSRRSYSWLSERRVAAEGTGGRAIWEMVYLNRAVAEGLAIFTKEAIDPCLDPHRPVGHIPPNSRLVAGLDPSAVNYQAGFLWAMHPSEDGVWRQTMIDLQNEEGGGIKQAHRLIRAWHEKYGCKHWVIEAVGFQQAILQDDAIREYARRNDIYLEPHHTGVNKWDPHFGVTSLQPLFEQRRITLPYGDAATRAKTDIYRRQLIYFSETSTKVKRRGTHADLVMASWFPQKVFRRLQKEHAATISVEYGSAFGQMDGSYWEQTPWEGW